MKIKACPSCRGICKVRVECTFIAGELRHRVICDCCGYRSGGKPTEAKAVEDHNRLSELAGAETRPMMTADDLVKKHGKPLVGQRVEVCFSCKWHNATVKCVDPLIVWVHGYTGPFIIGSGHDKIRLIGEEQGG